VSQPLYSAIAVVDIEKFGTRTDVAQGVLRKDLHAALAEALRAQDIDQTSIETHDTGDGAILRIAPGIPKIAITRAMTWHLHRALVSRCLATAPVEEMRLRVALHAGEITRDHIGLHGTDLNTASRLVDAQPLREVLAAAQRSHAAVIVSDAWYRAVVKHGHEGISAESFAPVRITVKEVDETAWVTVPGLSVPPGLPPHEPERPTAGPSGRTPSGGGAAQAPAGQGSPSFAIYGNVQGDAVQGGKTTTNYYGDGYPGGAGR
jgi:hypothetical protein